MAVSELMTENVICVSPETTLSEAMHVLETHKIHHLLITEGAELKGIISDRDVLKNISPYLGTSAEEKKDQFTAQRTVDKIMNKQLVTVDSSAGIVESCKTFLSAGVSLLPVLDNGKLVGVLSWRDILKHFTK